MRPSAAANSAAANVAPTRARRPGRSRQRFASARRLPRPARPLDPRRAQSGSLERGNPREPARSSWYSRSGSSRSLSSAPPRSRKLTSGDRIVAEELTLVSRDEHLAAVPPRRRCAPPDVRRGRDVVGRPRPARPYGCPSARGPRRRPARRARRARRWLSIAADTASFARRNATKNESPCVSIS